MRPGDRGLCFETNPSIVVEHRGNIALAISMAILTVSLTWNDVMKALRFLFVATVMALAFPANAHDTWVEVNSTEVRLGQVVHVDLKLGNHGNNHRDFKLASKISLAPCTLAVVAPDGQSHDLKPKVVDTGFAPKEGYWTARFVPTSMGLHAAWHTLDTLHGTTRAIKSSKSYFVVGDPAQHKGDTNFSKPLGGAIEMVPLTNPALTAAGQPIAVQVLFKGQPLKDAHVTFVPRGQHLAEGFDEKFERKTNDQGRAEFTPSEGNWILAVVHHMVEDEKGEKFDKTAYSATMTFNVAESLP